MKLVLSAIAGISLVSLLFATGYASDFITPGNGNAPFIIANTDNGRFDFSNDDKTDYWVKAHYTGNSNQQLKIDYKFQNECVDDGPWDGLTSGGDTFEDAALRMGVTNFGNAPGLTWLEEDITLWNPWFKSKKHDDNRMIDLAVFPTWKPAPFPADGENGDDIIQSSGKKGSFKYSDSIAKLDGQPGWEGSVFLNAPPGDYLFWTIHPAGGIDGCDRLRGLAIPIHITE